jgi:subtilisin family serine protease
MALAASLVCAGLVFAQEDAPDRRAQASEEFVDDATRLEAGDPIPGQYIVVLDDEVENPASVAEDLSGEVGLEPTNVYDDTIEGFGAEVPRAELGELRDDPRVEAVVQDRVVQATVQTVPSGIERIEADGGSAPAGNVEADIAIIDSGIYKQHPDLNIAGGYNCVGKKRRAWSDGYGHGTHVAGTAAARNNDVGVVGVAPGARLWGIKVLDDKGFGSFNSVICGVDWVTARAGTIEVANLSLGAPTWGSDDNACGWKKDRAAEKMHRAVCRSVAAGVFYAAAAGNDGKNIKKEIPAAFNQVLTATAMADFDGAPGGNSAPTCKDDQDDTFANFSNYASASTPDADHTIAAPGVCVRSTWTNGKYRSMSGTSMASPHVAGTAALCIEDGPCASNDPEGTMARLRTDAEQKSGDDPLAPDYYGYQGDPNRPAGTTRYYGFLEYAGGY